VERGARPLLGNLNVDVQDGVHVQVHVDVHVNALVDGVTPLRDGARVAHEDPGTERKKHRHDLGQEDHGPRLAAGTTRTIQALLGLWIALTVAFIFYALVDSTTGRHVDDAARQPAPAAATSSQR
jgi:hypothetical protein